MTALEAENQAIREEIRAQSARHEAELEELKTSASRSARARLVVPGRPRSDDEDGLSRRGLLKRLGGAAAGAGLAAGASALGANRAAATHSPAGYLHIGSNNAGTFTDLSTSGAYAFKGENSGSGSGLVAHSASGVGLSSSGGSAPLRLVPSTSLHGPPNSGTHELGEIFVDYYGAIYQCVLAGSPGTWMRIGLNAPGNLPQRIADTRPSEGPPKNPLNVYNAGPFRPRETREITVAGLIGPPGAQRTLAPVQALAANLNVAVTNTTAVGYLTIYPAHHGSAPNVSNLNWAPGQTISNSVTATLGVDNAMTAGAGKIKVFNGSAGTADVIIDLFGFYS